MFQREVRPLASILALVTLSVPLPHVAQGENPSRGLQPARTSNEPGVLVRLYDVGEAMKQLPEIARGELPSFVRVASTVELVSSRGDFKPLEDYFVTEVLGFLTIEERSRGTGFPAGLGSDNRSSYTFRLASDDGSKLWIDDRLVIDNDGLHGPAPKDGTIVLTPGQHPLRVMHFEAGGGEQLTLKWKPPGTDKQAEFTLIPAKLLTHDAGLSDRTSPGKKRIIRPLRRGRPGDGTPVAGMHPSYPQAEQPGETPLETPVANFSPAGCLFSVFVPGGSLSVSGTPPTERVTEPVVWLPPSERGYLLSFAGSHRTYQSFVGNGLAGDIKRLFVEGTQGCVFRFSAGIQGGFEGVRGGRERMIGGKDGPWLVGRPGKPSIRDNNDGELVAIGRLLEAFKTTFEMSAVRAKSNGMEIEFTNPLDTRVGWDPESYYIEQWPYDVEKQVWPTRDGIAYPVKSASVSVDRRKVFLEIDGLKESHLVYLRLLPPCLSKDGELPWSTEAWYTLRKLPDNRLGTVLARPKREPQNLLTDAERSAGWRLLFDGKTTKGWRGFKKDYMPDGWQVRDGCIVRVGSAGDIITEEQFDNFELAIEWRICAGGNSGIFYHVSEEGKNVWNTAPEMQVLDNSEHVDGRDTKTSAGANYALHAPIRDVTEPVGLFNKVRIVVDGSHVEHWLNGVKIVEYELGGEQWEQLVANSKFKSLSRYGRTTKGHIALQDHGDKVWYRNIKIRTPR